MSRVAHFYPFVPQFLRSKLNLAAMESSSFTIVFPEHLSPERREYCLFHLRDLGASVEPIDGNQYLVLCHKPKDLSRAGHFLFHTHVASYTQVVAVSGDAELRASAYRGAT